MQAQLSQLQASQGGVKAEEFSQILQQFQELETQLRGTVAQQQAFFNDISRRIDSGFAVFHAIALHFIRGRSLGKLFLTVCCVFFSMPYLDVPEVNAEAMVIAQKYEMTSMFETARMYCPIIPQLPTERIFGVTTFELG
jgi:hypothetical protein